MQACDLLLDNRWKMEKRKPSIIQELISLSEAALQSFQKQQVCSSVQRMLGCLQRTWILPYRKKKTLGSPVLYCFPRHSSAPSLPVRSRSSPINIWKVTYYLPHLVLQQFCVIYISILQKRKQRCRVIYITSATQHQTQDMNYSARVRFPGSYTTLLQLGICEMNLGKLEVMRIAQTTVTVIAFRVSGHQDMLRNPADTEGREVAFSSQTGTSSFLHSNTF